MNWYLAKLVYQVTCGLGNHTPQFDEQLRLIFAEDYLHAFNKARLIGDSEAADSHNTIAIAIRWKFIDVSELLPLGALADGAEIYAAVREETDAVMYIRATRKKAVQLLQQGLHLLTSLNPSAIGNQYS